MIITTSRKPSQKTRALCRRLAAFLGAECANRGKMSLHELAKRSPDGYAVIGEYKGNPGNITIQRGEAELELRISVRLLKDVRPGPEVVVVGEHRIAEVLADVLGLPHLEYGEYRRLIYVSRDRLEFIDRGEPRIILAIRGGR